MIYFKIVILFILAIDLTAVLIPYSLKEFSSTESEAKSQVFIRRLRRSSNNSDDADNNNLIFSDPILPTLPEDLKNTDPDCVFWQYIQAKPLTVEEVRQEINGLCVQNSTQNNNGWCEIELNLIVKQFGSNSIKPIHLDKQIIEKIDFKFFIHFTKSGLWQVVGIPNCDENEEETKKRVVRSIFKY